MAETCPHCNQPFSDKPDLCPVCGKALYRVCSVCGKTDSLSAEWYQSQKTKKIVCGDCFHRFKQDKKTSSGISTGKEGSDQLSKELFESDVSSEISQWSYIATLIGAPVILAFLLYGITVEAMQSMMRSINEPSFNGGLMSMNIDFGGIMGIIIMLVIIFSVLPLIFNTIMLHVATVLLKFKKRSLVRAFLVTLTASLLGLFLGGIMTGFAGFLGLFFMVFLYLVIIKHYYKCSYQKAFFAWLLSTAVVFGVIFVVLMIMFSTFGFTMI